jgi:hypothetical protein
MMPTSKQAAGYSDIYFMEFLSPSCKIHLDVQNTENHCRATDLSNLIIFDFVVPACKTE